MTRAHAPRHSPCFIGVQCFDVPAPGVGFTCGDCPYGFNGAGLPSDGITCLEESCTSTNTTDYCEVFPAPYNADLLDTNGDGCVADVNDDQTAGRDEDCVYSVVQPGPETGRRRALDRAAVERRLTLDDQVRKTPSWPRSWAYCSLF